MVLIFKCVLDFAFKSCRTMFFSRLQVSGSDSVDLLDPPSLWFQLCLLNRNSSGHPLRSRPPGVAWKHEDSVVGRPPSQRENCRWMVLLLPQRALPHVITGFSSVSPWIKLSVTFREWELGWARQGLIVKGSATLTGLSSIKTVTHKLST